MSVAPVRRRRRAFALVGAALGICLGLTGCSEDAPEPAPLESPVASQEPSESPEPSATPSDGPPEMPEAAKGTSKKSAEAFVRYAVEVLNYTSRTLDTRPLPAVFANDCAACVSIVTGVRQIARRDGSIRGGEWTVKQAGAIGNTVNGQQLVQLVVRTDPQTILESRGADPQQFEGDEVVYDFRLSATPNGWRVANILEASR
jgi:hypothetical protein